MKSKALGFQLLVASSLGKGHVPARSAQAPFLQAGVGAGAPQRPRQP